MKLSSGVNGKKYLTSCWRQSCIMFSRRTRWSQHFQRMGTRYTSRCRRANNLDKFAWLMGDSPYYKFAPLPVRPHYGEPTPSNIAELAMGRNFQIRLVQKKTSIFLWVFSVSPLSTRVIPYFFLLFSCALVPEGTCTTWEAPLKGSVPRQIATCERYMKVHKTTLR